MKDFFLALIILSILTILSTVILGTSQITPPEATTDKIMNLLDSCKIEAIHKKIQADKLSNNILACINRKLEDTNYQTIKNLPTVNN